LQNQRLPIVRERRFDPPAVPPASVQFQIALSFVSRSSGRAATIASRSSLTKL
jgi:hypothetical protein